VRKIIVSERMTLDGIFDAATMDEWHAPFESEERGAYLRQEILDSDIYLLGRATYVMLTPYWSLLRNNEMGVADKLNSMTKVDVSSTLKTAEWNNTTILHDNVIEAISKLKLQPGRGFLINGSATLVESLMPSGLIEEYRFLIHSIIMGRGKSFFHSGMHTHHLKLVDTRTFSHGVVLDRYQVGS